MKKLTQDGLMLVARWYAASNMGTPLAQALQNWGTKRPLSEREDPVDLKEMKIYTDFVFQIHGQEGIDLEAPDGEFENWFMELTPLRDRGLEGYFADDLQRRVPWLLEDPRFCEEVK